MCRRHRHRWFGFPRGSNHDAMQSGQQGPPPQPTAAERSAQAQAAIEAAKAPPVEDFKPSTLNQKGKEYPAVNSERRIRARVAPGAQSVALDIGAVKYTPTKGEDGAWVGATIPQDEGFHYYHIVVDGAQVPDPGYTPRGSRNRRQGNRSSGGRDGR